MLLVIYINVAVRAYLTNESALKHDPQLFQLNVCGKF
jgi:hypothetical protein